MGPFRRISDSPMKRTPAKGAQGVVFPIKAVNHLRA
jgi:hypothetical protein